MGTNPKLLLLGTFHLEMNPDLVNHHQKEISRITQSLKAFEPTKIAVEKTFLLKNELNRKLEAYKSGNFKLGYDIVDQLGYRLAEQLGLEEVFPVDEDVNMNAPSLNQVFKWAENYQPGLLQEIAEIQQQLVAYTHDDEPLTQLQAINSPEYRKLIGKLYMKLALVGDPQHQVGAAWLKQWHHRDLAIFANVSRIAAQSDRMLLMIGKDHLPLLSHFFDASGELDIVHTLDYLPQEK
ncbi:hypothetical protein SAMN05421743_10363 [Thalassobacillus cyri]|uniref:TraB family protein n=1 Tax=Thalassobacillus cyri TaxID=571932 RepID=A0A1H3YZG5_9BACI|nr:DUF5694 domain-containing protein [Thalassobacillus cyri]SEA16454.1 hypothetical protein SAMN05421743_10363 [Thalassobacillus cyri]